MPKIPLHPSPSRQAATAQLLFSERLLQIVSSSFADPIIARPAHILAHQLIGKPHGQHSPPGRPLLLMITPRHHCTRMLTSLALSHELGPAVVEVGLETAHSLGIVR